MHVVVVTNLWPSARRPAWGSFVADRVEALRRAGHRVELVAVADHASGARRYASMVGGTVRALVRGGRPPRSAPGTVVEAHIAYPTGLFAVPLARRLGAPLVLFAHGSDVLRLPERSPTDRRLARAVFARADLVIANSEYLAGEVIARLDVPERRVRIVSPGVRYGDFSAARAARADDTRAGWLFVANLIHRKGLDVLFDAMSELRREGHEPERLTVIGDGEDGDRLRERARRDGLDVEFLGARPHADVAHAMAGARLVVVPSREEALGLAALEAMAAGAIPVVSAVGGLAEQIEDGVNGFGCPSEDPVALAAALRRAQTVADDPAARRAMARAGDETARSHDVEEAARATVGLYESLEGQGV